MSEIESNPLPRAFYDADEYISPIRENTGMRLLVFFGAFFFLILISAGFGLAFQLIQGIGERSALLMASAVQCLVAFCLTAWIAARFSSNSPWDFMKVNSVAPSKVFAGVLIVYILALPGMNQLIEWNANINFPEWAKGLETTLRDWEENNGSVAETVLKTNGFWGMVLTVLVVGVLTGFSEEIFFRGALQRIFIDSKIRKGVAIWATAVIFSAIHFQFFGFVPRLLMGAFFGYLIVWTGSLWPAVFAHALNNSLVVITYYFLKDSVDWTIDSIGVATEGEGAWTALASLMATTLFFMKFRAFFFKTQLQQ